MSEAAATVLAPGSRVEEASAEEVVAHVLERFHPQLYVAASFQKETAVVMDMVLAMEPEARFFTLDTGVLFPETYAAWRAAEERYGVRVDVYQGMSLARQSALEGDALWERDPDRCCTIRKLTPLGEALSGVSAWMTGLRREQSPTRAGAQKLHWDDRHSLWKANPLADWSEADVWEYVAERELPYNELHERGYASIGCTHCTVPAAGRDGRWAGRSKIECGLHD
ncbi:MAG TPA: phosphoadenylyl-sulfate reductase [Thermoleophilaceae bacterium]|nr:phosphoadenylyl-sulfate reductase [Thermoleophilaceae bacterium]